MEVNAILAQLRAERDQINAAILSIETLARGGGKRRGRPPKWMSALTRMAEAQRRRWAAKHHAAASAGRVVGGEE